MQASALHKEHFFVFILLWILFTLPVLIQTWNSMENTDFKGIYFLVFYSENYKPGRYIIKHSVFYSSPSPNHSINNLSLSPCIVTF